MQTEKFIENGITEMLKADKDTSLKRSLLETSERNITAHLRGHLDQIGCSFEGNKYQIDNDYNRIGMGNIPKNLSPECLSLRKKNGYVVPDIVVHLRGIEIKDNQNANWLVIEVKKIPNFTGVVENIKNKKQKENLKYDIQKLNCFKKDERFKYKQSASIVFSNNGIWISLNDEQFKKLNITTKHGINSLGHSMSK